MCKICVVHGRQTDNNSKLQYQAVSSLVDRQTALRADPPKLSKMTNIGQVRSLVIEQLALLRDMPLLIDRT